MDPESSVTSQPSRHGEFLVQGEIFSQGSKRETEQYPTVLPWLLHTRAQVYTHTFTILHHTIYREEREGTERETESEEQNKNNERIPEGVC